MTVTEFLKSHVPFLEGLEDSQANALARAAQQQPCEAGKRIIMQGETVDSLHVIATGKVEVSRKEPGRNAVVLAQLGPGMVFGETSIVEMGVAGATIRALEESLIFVIPQAAFMAVMDDNPALKASLLAKIAARRPPPKKQA
jgi:CBS domain-containing protein